MRLAARQDAPQARVGRLLVAANRADPKTTPRVDLAVVQAVQPAIALELLAKQPSGRVGRPEDVAELVLYLLSDASVLVTGAEIPIDAGMTAS